MAAYEGTLLLPRQEEGEEEGADRERHAGGHGRGLVRAVSNWNINWVTSFTKRKKNHCKISVLKLVWLEWILLPSHDPLEEEEKKWPKKCSWSTFCWFHFKTNEIRILSTSHYLWSWLQCMNEHIWLSSSLCARDASKTVSSPPTSPRPGSASGSAPANVVPPRQQKPASSGATRKKAPQKKKKSGKGGW